MGHTTAVSSSSSELAKGDCGVCRQCGGCDSWDPQGWMHVTAEKEIALNILFLVLSYVLNL